MEESEDLTEQNLALIQEKARKFHEQRRELSEAKQQIEVLNDQLMRAKNQLKLAVAHNNQVAKECQEKDARLAQVAEQLAEALEFIKSSKS